MTMFWNVFQAVFGFLFGVSAFFISVFIIICGLLYAKQTLFPARHPHERFKP